MNLSFMRTYDRQDRSRSDGTLRGAPVNLPTMIARSNVRSGHNGGWPSMRLEQVLARRPIAVHTEEPSAYNPIHEDDIVRTIPALLAAASVPATIVNCGGNDAVSIEEWSRYLASLVGTEAMFIKTHQAFQSVMIDLMKQHALVDKTQVDWKEGMRSMVVHFHREIPLKG